MTEPAEIVAPVAVRLAKAVAPPTAPPSEIAWPVAVSVSPWAPATLASMAGSWMAPAAPIVDVLPSTSFEAPVVAVRKSTPPPATDTLSSSVNGPERPPSARLPPSVRPDVPPASPIVSGLPPLASDTEPVFAARVPMLLLEFVSTAPPPPSNSRLPTWIAADALVPWVIEPVDFSVSVPLVPVIEPSTRMPPVPPFAVASSVRRSLPDQAMAAPGSTVMAPPPVPPVWSTTFSNARSALIVPTRTVLPPSLDVSVPESLAEVPDTTSSA